MPNTDAGLPFTSRLRRSILSTVDGSLLMSALAGSACEYASLVAAEVATADNKNLRRDSIKAPARPKLTALTTYNLRAVKLELMTTLRRFMHRPSGL